LFGHATIEGWHLEHTALHEHTPLHGLVTRVGQCERTDDDVECPGRFTSSDGRVADRPVTLNRWRSDPPEPVPAKLAGPSPLVVRAGAPPGLWAEELPRA